MVTVDEVPVWCLVVCLLVHRLRRFCTQLIAKPWFDYLVLFFIALNCITLAMERPDIPSNSIVSDLHYCFYVA